MKKHSDSTLRAFNKATLIRIIRELYVMRDKAIEYIDRHIRIDDEYPAYMEMLIEERDELLDILQGNKEKENNGN